MDIESEERSDERGALHFQAALTDELMRTLSMRNILSRADIQEIENRAAQRVGTTPRAW